MTGRNYILDECLIHHASNLVDHLDEASSIALKVFTDIEYNCDSLLVSIDLLSNYRKHISILQKNNRSDASIMIQLLFRVLPHRNKFKVWEYDIHPLADENDLPEDDKYLVRLAHISRATLITSDMRLIGRIDPDENGYSSRFGIRVLTPNQAIIEINS